MGFLSPKAPPPPQPDPALVAAQKAAEKRAADEKAKAEKAKAEEIEQTKRGLRGARSLISGDFTGFSPTGGTNTLGATRTA